MEPMAGASAIFAKLITRYGLSHSEIETHIYDFANKHGTDDHDVIANFFLELHCKVPSVMDGTGTVDAEANAVVHVQELRIKIKNFMLGCPDLEAQRVVRRRISTSPTTTTATVTNTPPKTSETPKTAETQKYQRLQRHQILQRHTRLAFSGHDLNEYNV